MGYSEHPGCKAFLAAILDNPGDDTPRLAFADWLDETDDPDAAILARRIRKSVAAWAAGDRRITWHKAMGALRGFIGAVRCSWGEWLRRGSLWMRARPIESVAFTDAEWVRLRIEREYSTWIMTATIDAPGLLLPSPTGVVRHPRLSLEWRCARQANTPSDRDAFIRGMSASLRDMGRHVAQRCDRDGYPLRTVIDHFSGGFPDEWRLPIMSK